MTTDFVRHIQIYTARNSVTASAARGQGAPGLVAAARRHFETVDLGEFAANSESAFRRTLDRHTTRLAEALPVKGRSWGVSRKLLNIFLRNAFYTTYLHEAFDLGVAEEWFEVPLDGVVARRLRIVLRPGRLPEWPGVRQVTPELSETYQGACRQIAGTQKIAPVHLDAVFWGSRED